MSRETGIEWCTATWNPVVGCDRVSPGCAHCYAKALHDQRNRAYIEGKQVAVQYHKPFEVVQLKPERLVYPLSWRKSERIFVNSVSDLFHDDVPERFIATVFAVMALADRHTFQVLTKRPTRMHRLLNDQEFVAIILDEAEQFWERSRFARGDLRGLDSLEDWNLWMLEENWPIANVWLGVSVENQRWANKRIPLLLDTPASRRFLSCEPLLGPVYIPEYLPNPLWNDLPSWQSPTIDWIIAGAESGDGARPMDEAWVRQLRNQCKVGKIPFMYKQSATPNGRKLSLPMLDGRQWTEMPELTPV